ncbi:TPA: hypothetical protein RJR38_004347 [Burkholderia multivorans]|nr:hypothetical protein [Burkholderia multivorans]
MSAKVAPDAFCSASWSRRASVDQAVNGHPTNCTVDVITAEGEPELPLAHVVLNALVEVREGFSSLMAKSSVGYDSGKSGRP